MSSRKVIVCELLSLDGVAENAHPFFTEWGDAVDAANAGISPNGYLILDYRIIGPGR